MLPSALALGLAWALLAGPSTAEWVAAAVGGLAAAALGEVTRQSGLSAARLAELPLRPLLGVPRDVVRGAASVLADVLRGRVGSRLSTLELPDEPTEARQAQIVLAGDLSPDVIYVDVNPRRRTVLLHRLHDAPPPRILGVRR
jgi:hypothetical protein